MSDNVFKKKAPVLTLENYVQVDAPGRENIGNMLPVFVYRLFQFTMRDELTREFGKEKTVDILRKAGYAAGTFFAENLLDRKLPFNEFVAQLCENLEKYKIGILRIEKTDEETGKIVLTVSEDADCSGLPILGETVCNYDEGFLAGIAEAYNNKKYIVREIDCWASGAKVCRFEGKVAK